MTPDAMLAEAERRGIVLFPDGGGLGFDAPAGTMTPEFRAALIDLKPALLALLKARPVARASVVEIPDGFTVAVPARRLHRREEAEFVPGPQVDLPGPTALAESDPDGLVEHEPIRTAARPTPRPEPETEAQFWQSWLRDLVESGTAAAHLPQSGAANEVFEGMMLLDLADPEPALDRIRALVGRFQARVWPARYRAAGLPLPPGRAEAEDVALDGRVRHDRPVSHPAPTDDQPVPDRPARNRPEFAPSLFDEEQTA